MNEFSQYYDSPAPGLRQEYASPSDWSLVGLAGDSTISASNLNAASSADNAQALSDADLRQLAADNTVRVSLRHGNKIALGTGAVIDEDNGQKVILTDDHVVNTGQPGSLVDISYQGMNYQSRIIGRDPVNDVAVLSLPDELDSLDGLKLAETGRAQEGLHIVTAGHPGGSFQTVITEGTMGNENSASSMRITDAPPDQDPTRPLEAARLTVKHGNSGGAVLNDLGEVIGLVEAGDGDAISFRKDRYGNDIGTEEGDHSIITPVDLVRLSLADAANANANQIEISQNDPVPDLNPENRNYNIAYNAYNTDGSDWQPAFITRQDTYNNTDRCDQYDRIENPRLQLLLDMVYMQELLDAMMIYRRILPATTEITTCT